MKKIAITFILLSSFLILLSRGQDNAHDEGFDDGYHVGFDNGYVIGYEDGYDDAEDEHDYYIPGGYSDEILDIIWEIHWDAADYAARESENDIESAMVIVDCYLNNKPDDGGEWYSLEDFKEASLILYNFYEYFYSQHYR